MYKDPSLRDPQCLCHATADLRTHTHLYAREDRSRSPVLDLFLVFCPPNLPNNEGLVLCSTAPVWHGLTTHSKRYATLIETCLLRLQDADLLSTNGLCFATVRDNGIPILERGTMSLTTHGGGSTTKRHNEGSGWKVVDVGLEAQPAHRSVSVHCLGERSHVQQ